MAVTILPVTVFKLAQEQTRSAALLLRVAAHRVLVFRAALPHNPNRVLVAIVHRLVLQIVYHRFARSGTAPQLDAHRVEVEPPAQDLADTPAQGWPSAQFPDVKQLLPEDRPQLVQ